MRPMSRLCALSLFPRILPLQPSRLLPQQPRFRAAQGTLSFERGCVGNYNVVQMNLNSSFPFSRKKLARIIKDWHDRLKENVLRMELHATSRGHWTPV